MLSTSLKKSGKVMIFWWVTRSRSGTLLYWNLKDLDENVLLSEEGFHV
jgi:hypothetical protein